MATHSSILAWRIPWTEEPGGLQSMGSQSWTQLNDSHTYYVVVLKQLIHLTSLLGPGFSYAQYFEDCLEDYVKFNFMPLCIINCS